ncbi:hypothetical protein ROZALSC1DRAFT_24755 [Rozella allomycis CSF55]|uniref:RNase III domain-containing protein n=1 Tax=Rozella allomycis (strain CSF55) TaxID=988480 RepID=A0A4P9YCA4_ROZAC|nr:hypothetical protein ROZALSC1DRAFT_24755 [Rozella allomycis CSF55]
MFKPPLPPKIYCDAYEALIGACFIAFGWDQVKKIVLSHFEPIFRSFLHPELYIPRYPSIGYLKELFVKVDLKVEFHNVPLEANEKWVAENLEHLRSTDTTLGDKLCGVLLEGSKVSEICFSLGNKKSVEIALSVKAIEKYFAIELDK